MEGLYSKWPRIDKELILQYHKGLIATTCCIGASVPQTILKGTEEEGSGSRVSNGGWIFLARIIILNCNATLMPEQETINNVLTKYSKKYNVKMMRSNDSHYVDQRDSTRARYFLLCIEYRRYAEHAHRYRRRGWQGLSL